MPVSTSISNRKRTCARYEVQPRATDRNTVAPRPSTAQVRAPRQRCTTGKNTRLHTMSATPEMLSGRLSCEDEKSSPARELVLSVLHNHLQPTSD